MVDGREVREWMVQNIEKDENHLDKVVLELILTDTHLVSSVLVHTVLQTLLAETLVDHRTLEADS